MKNKQSGRGAFYTTMVKKWPVEPHCFESARPRPPHEGVKLPIGLSLSFVPIRDLDPENERTPLRRNQQLTVSDRLAVVFLLDIVN